MASTTACVGTPEETLDEQASLAESPFALSLATLDDRNCDPTVPEVQIIRTAADWLQINDPNKRVFCVAPGNYTSVGQNGQIELRVSGNPAAPRIIRVHPAVDNRGALSHPVRLPVSRRAVIRGLKLTNNASHWIIDGITVSGSLTADPEDYGYNIDVTSGSQRNVFSRMLIEGGDGNAMLVIRENANYNTVQNSVIREPVLLGGKDRNCINLYGRQPNSSITGTQIIANEMYDCNQGVQLVVLEDPSNEGTAYPGTLIADNDIYLTSAMHRECPAPKPQCLAVQTPEGCEWCPVPATGECAPAESGIAIKGGGIGPLPEQRVDVLQNRIWGMRRTNPELGGTGAWGTGIEVCCFATSFVAIRDNVLLDNARGITLQRASRTSVSGNLLVSMPILLNACEGIVTGSALKVTESNSSEFYRNVVLAAGAAAWRLSEENTDYRCNVFLNSGPYINDGPAMNAQLDYNFYYGTQPVPVGPHDLYDPTHTADDAKHDDRTIIRRRHTGPEALVVRFGMASAESPYLGSCDPMLGSRLGIGVDDAR